MLGISDAAESIGLRSFSTESEFISDDSRITDLFGRYLCASLYDKLEADENDFKMLYTFSSYNSSNEEILDLSIFGNNGYLKNEYNHISGLTDNKISSITNNDEVTDNKYLLPNNILLADYDMPIFYGAKNNKIINSQSMTLVIEELFKINISNCYSDLICSWSNEECNLYDCMDTIFLSITSSNFSKIRNSVIDCEKSNIDDLNGSILIESEDLNISKCLGLNAKHLLNSEIKYSEDVMLGNQNELKSNYRNIKINNCSQIYLDRDFNGWVVNVNLHKGISNRTITLTEDQVSWYYETNIYANGSKDIILDD